MSYDGFVNIDPSADNMERFIMRTQLLEAVHSFLPELNGDLVDVGCGKMPYRELIKTQSNVAQYVGLDIDSALEYDKEIKPDHTWDGLNMPFEDGQFDSAVAFEVLEHCPDPLVVLKEIHRVLKTGSNFCFTVPFLWNLHEAPHDHYRYTPFAMRRLLEESGFDVVTIKAGGGWHKSMAQMTALWLKRSPLPPKRRKLYRKLLMPLVRKLLKYHEYESIKFEEGQMITGLYGVARKKG